MNENIKVPEGWKRVRLGEIVTENSKSPFKVEEADNEGSYPFFTSGEEILKHSKFLIDDENIFISTGGTAYVNYYNGKSSYSADTYSLKSKINTLYLYYFLYRKLNHITFRYFIGSGLEHLQKQDFKNSLDVTFPIDFKEQQKISEILETVDRAIEKTDKIIEKYKRIKQGLMQDLLTKGIDENGKIRSEKTHKFKDSPLGRIPEEWEVVSLGEVIISLDYGYTESATSEDLGPKFLRITDIQNDKVNWDNVPFCNIKKVLINKYLLQKGDILFARTGATTGKSYYIYNSPFSIFASYLIRIRPNPRKIEPLFLSYFFKSNKYWEQILTGISGSTQEGFNASKLKQIFIPLPQLHEQKRIAEILSQVDNTIEKEEAYKQKLERIKKGLMEDLLTGRVRVNELIKEEKNEK